jgi:hypothetical protein
MKVESELKGAFESSRHIPFRSNDDTLLPVFFQNGAAHFFKEVGGLCPAFGCKNGSKNGGFAFPPRCN